MKNFYKIWMISVVAFLLAIPAAVNGDSDFTNIPNPVTLEVFPNPVTGNDFTLSSNAEIAEVIIINILGQQVFEKQLLGETKINIELEIKEKGIYLVQVKTYDGRVTTKRILFK